VLHAVGGRTSRIENQPDQWWSVDGDPRLTSTVDFPCPSDEMAPAIRKIGKDLLLYDKTATSRAHGEVLAVEKLDELADVNNRHRRRTFLLCWTDSEAEWLLMEDQVNVGHVGAI
jgi:hypothetical protein